MANSKRITHDTPVDSNLDRPPARLNNYDSDTNTFSGADNYRLGLGSTSNSRGGRSNNEMANKKLNKENLFADSPDLSDITEGIDHDGVHRTSTPNMSKAKRSSSQNQQHQQPPPQPQSQPELKQIRKQIEELEKMYYEILRVIDPDKNSSYSRTSAQSSTSLSSFSGSSDHKESTKQKKKIRTHHSQQNLNNQKQQQQQQHKRSSSNQNFIDQNYDPTSPRTSDMNQLKHRFNRMETHLTSLAKTVAQISVELKSIKSIEDVIYNLRKEVHELKTINLGRSSSALDKISDLHRTASEPTVITSILNAHGLKAHHSNSSTQNSKNDNFNSKRLEFLEEKDKLKKWVPSYSNPRKLKKLTKFFGQEPPMLRLFLQKLNYEMYAPNFENEQITITELPYLSEERLKLLGIPLGPRLRILQEAQSSFRHENNTHSSLPSIN
jgi:hypothetical protein